VNLQMFPGEVAPLPPLPVIERPMPCRRRRLSARRADADGGEEAGAVPRLGRARRPRSDARHRRALQAPVATTLQGLSVFPATHPLHTGFGFGAAAVPAARNAFADCDCLLAVGTRFAEIATGSFGVTVPPNLIHVDINPQVFGANYPAA
jgi:acetolactate synthase-1/2/3 large subunit